METPYQGDALKLHSAVIAGLLATSWASALVCDNTFYFQSAYQVILAGKTADALVTQSSGPVPITMNGVEPLHADAEYDVMTRFKGAGACNDYKQTEIEYASRAKGQNSFQTKTTTSTHIKLNSFPYPFTQGFETDYWFSFASGFRGDTALVFEAVTKPKSSTRLHQWYGNAIVTRKVHVPDVGTPVGTRYQSWPTLNFDADSAALVASLLRLWTGIKDNDSQVVDFKVQLIRVTYDSVQPPASLPRKVSKSKVSGFTANQTGRMVLIHPGEGQATSEALGLYNMMGHKIATLHPTGYLYQWNGRTDVGAEASTGVYFVQRGSRILGKFFYSR